MKMMILFLLSVATLGLAYDPEVKMRAPEVIQRWGYPVEIHHVVTKDNYILELHRIPHGRNGSGGNKGIIFLQHGLLGSSMNWLVNLPEQSAGYVFADAGFDVWLGNSRGNAYSRSHTEYNTEDAKFWMFSWEEMSKYDLPAMINYVLQKTGEKQLNFVGHSESTLTMFAFLSKKHYLDNKIKTFFALTPMGSVRHAGDLVKAFLTPFAVQTALPILHMGVFSSTADAVCDGEIGLGVCEEFFALLGNPQGFSYNKTRTPVYLAHFPAGTSNRNMIHWGQYIINGIPLRYDYGPILNLYHYSNVLAPGYDYRKIKVPTVIFYGDRDEIQPARDVEAWLTKKISNVLKKSVSVPGYNHADFTWGMDAAEKVYKPIINYIENEQ